MGIKEGLIVAAAAAAPAFAASANQPYTEETKMTPQAAAACTVRLNRFHEDDYSTQDERYIGTQYEGDLRRNGKYGNQIFPTSSFSGITYIQKGNIPNQNNIFWATPIIAPETVEASFQPQSTTHDRYMPGGRYNDFYLASHGKMSISYPSQFVNWSESFETDVSNQRSCLLIKKSIVGHLPDYGGLFGTTSDSFANDVWKLTGKSSDANQLKKDPTVRFIDRDTRLQEDRDSGQLKTDLGIPAPFKPKAP